MSFMRGEWSVNKSEFLSSEPVRLFIKWIEPRLDKPGSFMHKYYMKRFCVNWQCDSIYSAYELYQWPFTGTVPGKGQAISGITFSDSYKFLDQLSKGLCQSIEKADAELSRQYSVEILKWGGVSQRNRNRIIEFGDDIIDYYKHVIKVLDIDHFDAKKCGKVIMNSGFTKIYAQLIDDFIMYDGRVGAALGLLIRQFCEDNGLNSVPDEVLFGYGTGREAQTSATDRRNPGNEKYKFPRITGNPRKHLLHNVKASWLLKQIIHGTESRFSQLDNGLNALQAALFMIGYDVTINLLSQEKY